MSPRPRRRQPRHRAHDARERENGTEHLLEAIEAHRENALKEWTRERVPLDWATTQNNLGYAQALLNKQLGPVHKLIYASVVTSMQPELPPGI